MFWKRKSSEPSERKSSVQEDNTTKREKPDQGAAEAGDSLVNQVTSLEELVNNTEKGLNEDKDEAQIKGAPARPHQPMGELTVQPDEESTDEENDLSSLLGKPDKEDETKDEEQTDSLFSIFDEEEEEVNPLLNLINSLPDITAKEVLDEAQEIKVMMREWQRN